MTQEISADNAQVADAGLWEIRFDSPDIDTFLHEAIAEFVDDLGAPGRGISWAITLLRTEGSITLASGSAASEAVDRAQSAFDDTPSRAAVRGGEFVLVTDSGRERRWPGYASTAVGLGIRSVLSVPLVPAVMFRITFNLYAPQPHVFTSADITAAVRFVRHASWTLRLAHQVRQRDKRDEELSSAQLSRALAPLALRALVREYGFSIEESLEYLRRAAGNLPQPVNPAFPVAMWESRHATLDPRESSSFRAARATKSRTAGPRSSLR
ncbi:GAF domain-containing protein [Arthrobacter sp. V4I6]|uniref:GAF domain-containing protein n=1 Tax=unclassified Arthrobacter TaxID=235627 RepID=UPI00277E873D|nr:MULTISPECIES: GAF domain-containing protein [unclassified Arthrobacter]MDQ0819594.1 GAF domain-containing protein [Arthrobacter sp. V1I7]MDQ0853774.1 GAF domain-containing protein [Arthrobacter sp. V4I6]